MCTTDLNQLDTLVRQAGIDPRNDGVVAQGSRRRRLWELDNHAHCPVIGVCLPLAALRRLVNKVLGGQAVADDYELHCGTVTDCKRRTTLGEAVQRELDRRYMLALRQAAKAKTTEALSAWWDSAATGSDIAGALWATLSHARCSPALEHRVLGQIHMLQHQAGMAARIDLDRFEALIDENAVLTRELAAAQQRSMRQVEDHTRRSEAQQSQIVQLRAELMARETHIASLREDLQVLEAAVPGLKSRVELARDSERLVDRNHELHRAQLHWQQEAERQRRRTEELAAELQRRDTLTTVGSEPDATSETPSTSGPA